MSVGQSVLRVDAVGKVTGATLYPGDINFPDQVYMKILFAHRVHAEISAIDTTAAENLPGVLAVFTARDVPNNEYGLIMPDQPVLCGPGSNKPFAERVRFVGDQVAGSASSVSRTPVCAANQYTARSATCSSVPGSSNRCVAPLTTASSLTVAAGNRSSAQRFISSTS